MTVANADVQPPFGCAGRAIIGTFETSGGDDGPAALAQLFSPTMLARDVQGNVYIVDASNQRIRRVTPAGVISTLAGNGIADSAGDGGPANQASLNYPNGIAVDGQGNVYVSEYGGFRIRRISPDGTITTIAGNGRAGFSGDGSAARGAMLGGPSDLAVDPQGNLFISDYGSRRIRRIASDGTITTIAGNGSTDLGGDPDGKPATSIPYNGGVLAIAANGDLLVSFRDSGIVASVDSSGLVHDVTGGLGPPPSEGANARRVAMNAGAIAIASDGSILVVSFNALWQVQPNGLLHQVAQSGPLIRIVAGSDGSVFGDNGDSVYSFSKSGRQTLFAGAEINGFSGDGGPAATAQLSSIGGLAVDKAGNVYVSDTLNNRIRRVTPDGRISTFAGTGGTPSAGDGGPASKAQIFDPRALGIDPFGNLYIAEDADQLGVFVRRVAPDGTITHFAGNDSHLQECVSRPCVPASGKATDAEVHVEAIASDSKGQIYLLDTYSAAIWKVDLQGKISIFIRPPQPMFGAFSSAQIQTDAADSVYWVDAGSRSLFVISPTGQFVQDKSLFAFVDTLGFAVDTYGNIDVVNNANGKIWKRSPAGAMSTLWDAVVSPEIYQGIFPLTMDPSGNLYFADQSRNRVFEIPNAGSCIGAQRPLVEQFGAFNAASYHSFTVAAGELVTFFGNHLGPAQGAGPSVIAGSRFDTQAGGVRVLFDGVPAPMLYASTGQVSAVVPYGVAGEQITQVSVEVNGVPSDPIFDPVVVALPGIFTRDSSGKGQAAAQNQDSSPNGLDHPAAKGSTVVLFATGAGVTKPASLDGVIAGGSPPMPLLAVTATVDGQPAQVVYAGGAPFEINGLLQVNVVIPNSAHSGPAIPIVVRVGAIPSQAGVTLAIE